MQRLLSFVSLRRAARPAPASWTALSLMVAGLLALCLSGPLTVAAQSSGDGSYYSRFGIGMLEDYSSPQAEAMGGGAYGLRTINYNPSANPALWADQVYTRATAAVGMQVIEAEDARGASSTLGAGAIEALQISFPLYTRRVGIGLSFQPYSTSNYEVFRSGSVRFGAVDDAEIDYETVYEGRGGLYHLRGGFGVRVSDAVRLGGALDVIFGGVKQNVETTFPGIDQTQIGPRDVLIRESISTEQTRVSGVTGTLGGQFTFRELLNDEDALGVGVSVTLPATLTGDRVRTLDESLDADTVAVADGDVTLPYQARLGLAYQPNDLWSIVLDGLYAPWSQFESNFDRASGARLGAFPVGGLNTINDRWRVSAGAEVVPAGNDRFAGYFARTGYRLGAYVEQQYTTTDPGTRVHVVAATGGLSLPTAASGTRVDLTLRAGMRGSTEPDLIRDIFYGVSLNVSIGERWFLDRKLR